MNTSHNQNLIFLIGLIVLIISSSHSIANPYPDAGRIYREFKDHSFDKPRAPQEDVIDQAPKPDTQGSNVGEVVLVSAFEVHGNTQLDDNDLHAVLNSYTDRELSNADMHEAADALMRRYRQLGFFAARVYVPPQVITVGVVKLYVYEGTLEPGGVSMTNTGERVRDSVIHALLEKNLETNKVIESAEVERALLLVEDLPGVTSHGTLYPGEQEGAGRLLVQTTDTPLISGNVDFDNFGSYYTGEYRLGTTIYVDSPTKSGDQLTLRLVSSGEDSNYIYTSYDIPVSGNGMRLGGSFDYLDYQLDKEFKALGSEGDISELRIFASYPFIRSIHFNLLGRMDYSHLELEDKDDFGLHAERSIDSGIFSLYGDHDDDWLASGVTYYSVELTLGYLDIDGNQAFIDFDDQNTETAGSFAKLNYGLSRLQHLTGNLSTYISLSGQVANENLDTSQKFYIGGPFSVAGYPTGEASGDEGVLLNADLRLDFYDMPWQGDLQLSAFYSWGQVKLFHNTWAGWQGGNPTIKNTIDLRSAGLGLNQTWRETFVLRAMIGWQIGGNDGSNPLTGKDSDNSDRDYRAWVQGIYYF